MIEPPFASRSSQGFSSPPAASSRGLLSRLDEHDRERLGEALRRLLSHGSILGKEPGQNDLYHWCHINREWVEELAGLLDLKVFWDHEERLVQAVPETSAFTLRLKLDATLVLLTLWYEFDTAVRDRGETPPIRLTVKQLNDSLKTKFEPLRRHLPSPTRLREILSLAQRKNLLRHQPAENPADAEIEILSTLKRVIPFQDLAEWNRNAERYLAAATGGADVPPEAGESEDEAAQTVPIEPPVPIAPTFSTSETASTVAIPPATEEIAAPAAPMDPPATPATPATEELP